MNQADELSAAWHLASLIAESGPISIATFMEIALAHPRHGYYATQPAISAEGDFITAPEVSQLFGEMVGVFALQTWMDLGAPPHWQLIELGPGRGTLAADVLRTLKIRPRAFEGCELHLVETSQPLRGTQATALAPFGLVPQWQRCLVDIADAPAVIIANEFFDSLPIRQFVRLGNGWCERRIALAPGSTKDAPQFMFVATPTVFDVEAEITGTDKACEGAIVEISHAGRAIAAEIGARLTRLPGRALVIDYGYEDVRHGNTLQAVRNHRAQNSLDAIGSSDVTAHVDFEALAAAARDRGAHTCGPVNQGAFLKSLGIETRHAALCARATPSQRASLTRGLERLTNASQMGDLFKVLALSSAHLRPPPGFPF